MHIKQNLRNIFVSFLFLILFDIIYFSFDFVVDYFSGIEIVLTVIAIALFCGLLYVGYLIGQKFLIAVKRGIVSIVIIPMAVLLLLYVIGLSTQSDIAMLFHFPAAFLFPAYLLPYDLLPDDVSVILLYSIDLLIYSMCCGSLLIGSYHKKHTQE